MADRKTALNDSDYPLLATKLYIPKPRPDLVQRTHLIERLNEGIQCKLALISAPAGFGKTTLLSEWIAQNQMPIAWISLDSGDNDPTRFLNYIVAALQSIEAKLGEAALSLLQSPQPPPFNAIIASLIRDIVSVHDNFILVFDDYHAIETAEIHQMVDLLIDRMPTQMHLVIATRVDPNLPLARMRVRNQLNEIRVIDLCFTIDEAAFFLNKVMRLGLSDQNIEALEARTEGWIAGLQLAALSMRGCSDIPGFIKAFAGDDRLIVDYLVEEVLNLQSTNVQEFLLHTSILNRLSQPLCDYVTNRQGSQKIMEDLEKANLFLVPLDNKRNWYRYHHLFADLLRARLKQSHSEVIASLHRRASDWFQQNDQIAESVNHALAAEAYNHAAHLIEQNTLRLLFQGELHTLLKWIKVLPEKVAHRRPWLCIYQALALAFAGKLDGIEPLLKDAERIIQHPGFMADNCIDEDQRQEMIGHIAFIRAFVAVVTGDFPRAIETANLAGETLPTCNLWARSVIQWLLGIAHHMHGDLTIAEQACTEVVRLGREMENAWTIVNGLTDLAMVYQTRGQLYKTAALCRETMSFTAERGIDNIGFTVRVEAGLAHVLYEQNDLKSAQHFVKRSIENTHKWNNPNHFVFSYIVLASVLLAQRDIQGTSDAIAKADQIKGKFAIMPMIGGMLEKIRIRLWLTLNNRVRIRHWAVENALEDAHKSTISSKIRYGREPLLITLARVYLMQDKTDEALELLDRLEETANSGGRINTLIEILVLRALALRVRKKRETALETMARVLTLAAPGGYIRIFIDEGRPMAELLEHVLDTKGDVPIAYVKKLLSAFRLNKLKKEVAGLVEPLSGREREVLRLIAAGLSNNEITEALFISLSTVKTHLRNIYGKLNVKSRTEAIVKAKELDLLN